MATPPPAAHSCSNVLTTSGAGAAAATGLPLPGIGHPHHHRRAGPHLVEALHGLDDARVELVLRRDNRDVTDALLGQSPPAVGRAGNLDRAAHVVDAGA